VGPVDVTDAELPLDADSTRRPCKPAEHDSHRELHGRMRLPQAHLRVPRAVESFEVFRLVGRRHNSLIASLSRQTDRLTRPPVAAGCSTAYGWSSPRWQFSGLAAVDRRDHFRGF